MGSPLNWRMMPPPDSQPGNPLTVYGRTYLAAATSATLDVPEFDGPYLRAAGWTLLGIVGLNIAPSTIGTGATPVNVNLSPPVGSNVTQLFGLSGTVYNVVNGFANVTIAGDVTSALNNGWSFAKSIETWYSPGTNPAAGAVTYASGTAVSGVALAAGGNTLAINAQPDVPRRLYAITGPGTISITAGALVVNGVDFTGTAYTDTQSLVMASAGAGSTYTLSHACQRLTSVSYAGLALTGGASIALGFSNFLGVPLPPNFANLAFTKVNQVANTTVPAGAATDVALNSVTFDLTYGLFFPPTAPDATHAYSVGYSYVQPSTN